MGQFTPNLHTPNTRWLAYHGFAHFDTKIGEGAQLLSYSHMVDHMSIMLIFQVNLIGQKYFLGRYNKAFYCASLPSFANI